MFGELRHVGAKRTTKGNEDDDEKNEDDEEEDDDEMDEENKEWAMSNERRLEVPEVVGG